MEIKDLKPKTAIDNIELEIVEVGEAKEFSNFKGKGRVANAKVKDKTGASTLILWNDQIEQVKNAKKVVVENGFANVYKDQIQITTGMKGNLKIVE
ncbi:MAG: hypothetical protein CVU81_02235 [Euryarchaeota archaeon HGW-Euryarchaeota-1]|nr:MAG: hypothetical protein CVU81_02235 [Euryarchaeota archaeon HGW-Euryarchaeota-1]